MAKKTGNTLKTVAVGIIIVLLTIGLSLFMITDAFQPNSPNAVAVIGDYEIEGRDFVDTVDQELQSYNAQNGTKLTRPQAYQQGIAQQILDRSITNALLDVDARKLNIGVSKTVARQLLGEMDVFQDEFTGEFSEDKVNEVLAQQRITRAKFDKDLIETLRRQQVVGPVVAGITAPLDYAQQRYNYITEQRKVTVLTLRPDSVPTPEAPSDEDLKSYIAANIADYTAPEYRRFTLLRIETVDLLGDVELTDEEVRESYDLELESGLLGTAETRSLILMSANNETLAKEAQAALESGTDAATVATDLGLPEPTTYEEVLANQIIDPDAAKRAFELDGDAIAIGEGKTSWYVVQMTGITPAVAPDFETQKPIIEEELRNGYAEDALADLVAAVEDATDEGLTVEEIGEKTGASISMIDAIDRRGYTQDNIRLAGFSEIPGVAADEAILTELFTNDIGYPSFLFETSSNGYAIVRVDEIIPSVARNFEDVKARATVAWTTEQIDSALDDLATELTERVRGGENLKLIAGEIGDGAVVEDIVMVRSSRSPQLGPIVLAQLFEARSGEVVKGQGPERLSRNIAIVNDVIANADNMSGGFADAMQSQASEGLSADIQQAYRAAILRDSKQQVFDDRIQALLGVTPQQ